MICPNVCSRRMRPTSSGGCSKPRCRSKPSPAASARMAKALGRDRRRRRRPRPPRRRWPPMQRRRRRPPLRDDVAVALGFGRRARTGRRRRGRRHADAATRPRRIATRSCRDRARACRRPRPADRASRRAWPNRRRARPLRASAAAPRRPPATYATRSPSSMRRGRRCRRAPTAARWRSCAATRTSTRPGSFRPEATALKVEALMKLGRDGGGARAGGAVRRRASGHPAGCARRGDCRPHETVSESGPAQADAQARRGGDRAGAVESRRRRTRTSREATSRRGPDAATARWSCRSWRPRRRPRPRTGARELAAASVSVPVAASRPTSADAHGRAANQRPTDSAAGTHPSWRRRA